MTALDTSGADRMEEETEDDGGRKPHRRANSNMQSMIRRASGGKN